MSYTSIIAYTFEADTHCPACTIARFGEDKLNSLFGATDREGNPVRPIFAWHDLRADYEDGLYCGDCGDCMFLPADLQPIPDTELTLFVPDDPSIFSDYHAGLSSIMYAVSATGALTMAQCPHTYRQAYVMLSDLQRELDRAASGIDTAFGSEEEQEDYIRLVTMRDDVAETMRDYLR